MADDPERDLIPTKEAKSSAISHTFTHAECNDTQVLAKPTLLEQKMALQLTRNDLEDQYHHLKDENIQLKKNSRVQEEQLKKLATKVSRLMNEKKKLELNSSPGRKRDIEMEEMIEELHDKIRNLERSNVHLREKLLVAKQQVITHARRPTPYNHIPPKVNTGRPRSGFSSYLTSVNLQGLIARNMKKPGANAIPQYALNLLEEARDELFNLRELVNSQKVEIDMYEQEVEILKGKLQMKEVEFEEDLNTLKSQITQSQRQHVQENLDLIRLHRELQQKNAKVIALQTQYADIEEKMRFQKSNHDRMVRELEDISSAWKDEQKKNMELFTELQKTKATLSNFSELQECIKTLKRENDMLKETNDKLINGMLNRDNERTSQSMEHSLKDQIFHLESSLKSEVSQKNELQGKVKADEDNYNKLNEEHRKLQSAFAEVSSKVKELESKVNFLQSENVESEDLGEALSAAKFLKEKNINISFLEEILRENEVLKSKLKKVEDDLAECMKELNGIRELLMTQYKVNEHTQDGIKSLTEKNFQQEKEFEAKIEEFHQLLDAKTTRIQELEKQINDIAYGTNEVKIPVGDEGAENAESLELNRGENIFEIRIIKFIFSKDGLQEIQNNNPFAFITWNFYEFELQSTPVFKGPKQEYNFSVRYTVKVDDFFLYYLHKKSVKLELHEAFGTRYRTLASCNLKLHEVIDAQHGKFYGTGQFCSIVEENRKIFFGTIDFCITFHVPMKEAFKLYKEKIKALKYLRSNMENSAYAAKLLKESNQENDYVNKLHVEITKCNNLKPFKEGVQPSAFCIYKFFLLSDHDTNIITSSSDPEFLDHHTFPLLMDSELDNYLKTQNLEIYVFDDNNPEITSYIGKASIPLLCLSQSEPLSGKFELVKEREVGCGNIEVSLYWEKPYNFSSDTSSLLEQLEKSRNYFSSRLSVTPVHSNGKVPTISTTYDQADAKSKPANTPIPKPRARTSLMKQEYKLNYEESSAKSKMLKEAEGDSDSSANTFDKEIKYDSSESSSIEDTIVKKVPQPAVRTSKLSSQTTRSSSSVSESPVNKPVRENAKAPSDFDKKVSSESGGENESQSSEKNISLDDKTVPAMVIGVHSLSFTPDAPVIKNTAVLMLYVEYRFLDYPLEELETPFSLPKPIPPQTISFNFTKVFPFHLISDLDKWKQLAKMFDSQVPENSLIKFTVVSEPTSEQEDLDCEDIGHAHVDLKKILVRGKDIVQEDIIIYDAENPETNIGKLNVTVQALHVLQLLKKMNL